MSVKVMVDTNVILYYLFDGLCPNANDLEIIQKLFKKAIEKKVKLLITTRILDEILFKALILTAGKNFKQLKKEKDSFKLNATIVKTIFNFIKDLNFEIVELKISHYKNVENIMKEYGLFGNDALTLAAMQSRNLKYIATFDDDFLGTFVENYIIKKYKV